MAAVPESPKFEGLKTAPDFTLKDENNNAVSLADARARGPVLLVFYRGFW
ncbi:MAG: redoxin domain-containing protein [Planctomycetia bacterium]|nr:redoxin domain-containing protein [Planctomycetia bacterium]MCC7315189.1 redoxin domain-containing protein [Planctomycetota bacterium]